jgi:polysaccharide pyruvyl transferase WcaK-like protein
MKMHIVVEPGSYLCLNMGDVAMMQVAVKRLGELWPHAQIEVVTGRPDRLLSLCSSAVPLSTEERKAWLSGRSLMGGLHKRLSPSISVALQRAERSLWLRFPAVTDAGVCLKSMMLRRAVPSPSRFRKRLLGADLLVVSGAGMINDAFADSACPLLDEMEAALNAGISVVAFGQGIGPMENPELLARARAVLPRLELIALREEYAGLPLLKSLGVHGDRILFTGDDAIESAYESRPPSLGTRIGVNLRLAEYAGIGEEILDRLRESLRLAAQSLNTSLVAVPISLQECESDLVSIAKLLDGGKPFSGARIESPGDVIRLIGGCRVVVTGSYHAGVFALAQGIPVVALVQSAYYEQKFIGLQDQFPGGCRLIDFRGKIACDELQGAIRSAWESAEHVRGTLLEAAARQVDIGLAAYRAARELHSLASFRTTAGNASF